MNGLVQHSSESNEHYSPSLIVEPARRVLGTIDLDPASCALANTVVKATHFLSADGLNATWSVGKPSRVFLNPPGGKLHPKTLEPMAADAGPGLSAAAVWWWKLIDEYEARHVDQAIVVVFSLNLMQAAQQYDYPPPYRFPFVVPAKRLRFWNEETPEGTGQPSQPNAIVYVPPKGPRASALIGEFKAQFSALGEVRT